MVSKELTILSDDGLHMRPAGELADAMGKYNCDVTIDYEGSSIDAKSIIQIMAACIKGRSKILIRCDGKDEEQALKEALKILD